jgi:exopolysaccharide production protein ExoZ
MAGLVLSGACVKLNSVQYLRGLAALLVVLTHALAHPYDSRMEATQRLGAAGVTLFFVISGFIMVRVSGAGAFDRSDFYRRRIERVVPLYWLATLALAGVAIVAPALLKSTRFEWDSLILSLLFVPHYRANGELVPLLKLGWTLNLEMFFYLLFGLFARFEAARRVLLLSGVLMALTLLGQLVAFRNPLLVAYTTPQLLPFCLGMWAALWLSSEGGEAQARRGAGQIGMAGVGLLLASLVVPGDYPALHLVLTQALGSVLLLVAAVAIERKLPQSRLTGLMGDASYSIYLVHMYPLAAVIVIWRRFAPDIPAGAIVALCLVVGVVSGVLVYWLAERPITRWFARRRNGGRRAAPVEGAGIAGELR